MSRSQNGLDWRSQAACLDTDPELFFPVATSGPMFEAQVIEAKAVCAGCPVRPACLEFALTALGEGVAGGLTADERSVLRSGRTHRASRDEARLERGLRPAASQREVAEAGRVLLAAGWPRNEVASRCAVSRRTVDRWAVSASDAGMAVGSRGGNRAPHLISHASTQAGTNAEGARG
jgi:hypothetical protein